MVLSRNKINKKTLRYLIASRVAGFLPAARQQD
jgi:hypothetical protein